MFYVRLFLFVALMGTLACSDGSTREVQVTRLPVRTLIFMDKSLSINPDRAFANQKYQRVINEIVEHNMLHKGDQIRVYFIHENTAKAHALTLTTRSEMDDVSQAGPTDREAAQNTYDLALQRERATFKRQLISKLTEQNTEASNQDTDIWASLPIIAAAAENVGEAVVNVYYLSDMIESMKGPDRRDFGKTPPRDKTQADQWARADANQLTAFGTNAPAITMVLPFGPNRSVKINNPAVTHYWQTLFKALGAGQVKEE